MRFTIHCEPDSLPLAARAARWGATEMPHKSAILVYGERPDVWTFYVERTKAGGISVRRVEDN